LRVQLAVLVLSLSCCAAFGQTYTISTFAGSGISGFSGDNGPATAAALNRPSSVAVDSAGNLYIADENNNRIRKVSGGIVTTVAGGASAGFSGDNGPATSATLSKPLGVAVDAAGNLYIADSLNNRVRKVSNGVITTVAGTGVIGFSGDNGPATSAELYLPWGLAVDSAGNLYIADEENHSVRKVSNGVITTIAGNGVLGYGGDNGPAVNAQLAYPKSLALDSNGDLYISDAGTDSIRKISDGVITTVAGFGPGFNGSAYPNPNGVAVDPAGNLYIVDSSDQYVFKISNGVITTIAGNGKAGFIGAGGPATSAELNFPGGIAVDLAGNVYIADSLNNRIRLLTPSASSACSFSLNPASLQFSAAGGSLTVAVQTTGACSWTVSAVPSWISVSGASSGIGDGTVNFVAGLNTSSATLNATISIANLPFAISQSPVPAGGPSFTSAGVTNAASFETGIVAGGTLTIFGTNLGAAPGQVLTASGSSWPAQLGGTSVTIGENPAVPVYQLLNLNGQEQLSVQAPWALEGTVGATVVVTTAVGASLPVMVPVQPVQPGIFILDGASSGAAHVNGTVAGASNPASPGEVVVVYVTGMGPVSNQPATGTSASLTALSYTAFMPGVTIGGLPAYVGFSGLAPGFIGLYQINVTVPPSASPGVADLIVRAGGVISNPAKLAIQ
jgi:uncharacterized protein (TIGR03437 family)